MKLLLKNILFTCVIPGMVGGYVPYRLGVTAQGTQGWWQFAGGALIVVGTIVLLLCIADFGKKGEGTPFPLDPPKNLVTSRIYQYSRNPMYVGVLTVIVGWALWFSSEQVAVYGFGIAAVFYFFVRKVEEPFLEKQFGEAYRQYCRQTPRWFRFFGKNV